jgi:hypothetical protein
MFVVVLSTKYVLLILEIRSNNAGRRPMRTFRAVSESLSVPENKYFLFPRIYRAEGLEGRILKIENASLCSPKKASFYALSSRPLASSNYHKILERRTTSYILSTYSLRESSKK